MCENNLVLTILLIIKISIIIILIIGIVSCLRTKEITSLFKKTVIIDLFFLLLLLIVFFINKDCIINSSFNKINNKYKQYTKSIDSDMDASLVKNAEKYKISGNKKLFFYNNNTMPLSNVPINCSNKIYYKNYGESVSFISSMLSTLFQKDISPVEIMDLAIDNNIFDCDTTIDFESLLSLVQLKYNVTAKKINIDELDSILKNKQIILSKIEYNENSNKNLTCNNGFIILYNSTESNYNYITNSTNKLTDYICPENTLGSFDIIKKDFSKTILKSDFKLINSELIILQEGGN